MGLQEVLKTATLAIVWVILLAYAYSQYCPNSYPLSVPDICSLVSINYLKRTNQAVECSQFPHSTHDSLRKRRRGRSQRHCNGTSSCSCSRIHARSGDLGSSKASPRSSPTLPYPCEHHVIQTPLGSTHPLFKVWYGRIIDELRFRQCDVKIR